MLSPLSRNTPRALCLFVIIPLSHGSADSVDQLMDSVCSSNLPAISGTLSGSQYPNGGVLRDEYGSVRLSLGHAHFLAVETRPVPHPCGLNRPAPSGGNAPYDKHVLLYTHTPTTHTTCRRKEVMFGHRFNCEPSCFTALLKGCFPALVAGIVVATQSTEFDPLTYANCNH